MNRTFHARIAAGQYIFLLLAGGLAFYNLWEQQVILAVIFVLLLVFNIEKLIHTTYTLTADGKLVLYYGRFARGKEIALKDITAVEQACSMKIGRCTAMHYVLVKHGHGPRNQCEALLPVKEAEFIRLLEERRT